MLRKTMLDYCSLLNGTLNSFASSSLFLSSLQVGSKKVLSSLQHYRTWTLESLIVATKLTSMIIYIFLDQRQRDKMAYLYHPYHGFFSGRDRKSQGQKGMQHEGPRNTKDEERTRSSLISCSVWWLGWMIQNEVVLISLTEFFLAAEDAKIWSCRWSRYQQSTLNDKWRIGRCKSSYYAIKSVNMRCLFKHTFLDPNLVEVADRMRSTVYRKEAMNGQDKMEFEKIA